MATAQNTPSNEAEKEGSFTLQSPLDDPERIISGPLETDRTSGPQAIETCNAARCWFDSNDEMIDAPAPETLTTPSSESPYFDWAHRAIDSQSYFNTDSGANLSLPNGPQGQSQTGSADLHPQPKTKPVAMVYASTSTTNVQDNPSEQSKKMRNPYLLELWLSMDRSHDPYYNPATIELSAYEALPRDDPENGGEMRELMMVRPTNGNSRTNRSESAYWHHDREA